MRSCSAPSSATKATRLCGITTAPSSSQTMTSSGKMAQPPQAIGSCQPTKVRPLTDAGAATPLHQTGSFEASTPVLSRTTPSVTSAVTLRFIMRMVRMSPKMPADETPMASATAMQPSGIASMAPRVEIGFDQLSGVARSSRTGTKRSVNAGPTTRLPEKPSGIAPLIQARRMPFFNSIVVIVPVVTCCKASSILSMAKSNSGGGQTEPLVTAAQVSDEWQREQHHPQFADDLSGEKVERTERQIEKHDRVHHQPCQTRSRDRGDESPLREGRIDGEVG